MCIEDIRLGRNTITRLTSVAVQVTSTQLLAGDAARIAIIFPVPATNPVWTMPNAPAVDGRGFKIYATGHFETLSVQTHGQMVMSPWNGISPAGAQTIDIIEVLLREQ